MAKVLCDCGCGRSGHPNRMTVVTIERATDETLRQTVVTGRYEVLKTCKKAFEEELAMRNALRVGVAKWFPRKRVGLQRLNIFLAAYRYTNRMFFALTVMRYNHAIFERSKGFAWARQNAIKSAVLFGCPLFMQAFLARRFDAAEKRAEARAAAKKGLADGAPAQA